MGLVVVRRIGLLLEAPLLLPTAADGGRGGEQGEEDEEEEEEGEGAARHWGVF